jgi:hypothetical protein
MPFTSPLERARRIALLKGCLRLNSIVASLPITPEQIIISWAIRLCEYEGTPADVRTIERLTGLPHASVVRNLKALHQIGSVMQFKEGRRSVQRLVKRSELPFITAFYADLYSIAMECFPELQEANKQVTGDIQKAV